MCLGDIESAGFNMLIETALQAGASDAAVISAADMVVRDDLAALCGAPVRCPNWGLSPNCPPHVDGPKGIRQWIEESDYAVVIRMDVPSAVLFSNDRLEVMQWLHESVAAVAERAVEMGFCRVKGFAGGSCKQIFCREHEVCRVVSKKGDCRHPGKAYPSMSGFGIDVGRLMRSAGWPAGFADKGKPQENPTMNWVAAMVLFAKNS